MKRENRGMKKVFYLEEVNIIRPLVIIMLVLMHAFTIYGGSWPKPEKIYDVEVYFWIQKLSFACMLEMFVFLSGYVFAYQVCELKKKYSFYQLIKVKFKRLIIPCIVFSIIYSVLFPPQDISILEYVYGIINGYGHMWFLPMLFWCFVATYFLLKLRLKEEIKLLGLLCLSIFPSSLIPLPLRMTSTMYYLFYFYLAFYIWNYREALVKKWVTKKVIISGCILFLIVFILLTLFLRNNTSQNILHTIIISLISKSGRIVYATLGLMLLYISAMYVLKLKWNIPNWFVKSNVLCMGVYLFQQFILMLLYYKLPMPKLLGTYWLPWIGFLVALFLSILLTSLLRKSQIGRWLVG